MWPECGVLLRLAGLMSHVVILYQLVCIQEKEVYIGDFIKTMFKSGLWTFDNRHH